MTKIYESDFNGWDESAEQIIIYKLDENEYNELDQLNHDELCNLIDVFDQNGYNIIPGAIYHTYEFQLSSGFLIVTHTKAINC